MASTLDRLLERSAFPKIAPGIQMVDGVKLLSAAKRATGHWGRHSMISRAVLEDMSDRQIMVVSGHRSPQMIARHSHLRDDDSKELAEMVSLPSKATASSKATRISRGYPRQAYPAMRCACALIRNDIGLLVL